MKNKLLLPICCLFLLVTSVIAQEETAMDSVLTDSAIVVDSALLPMPPTAVTAVDSDNDHGHSITVSWEISADDGAGKNSVMSYEIFRWVPNWMKYVDTLRGELSAFEDSVKSAAEVTTEMEEKRDRLRSEFASAIEELPSRHGTYPEEGSFASVGIAPAGSKEFVDSGSKVKENKSYIPDFTDYYYRVDAITSNEEIRSSSEVFGPVQSFGQWFNNGRTPVLFAVIIFALLTVYFVYRARKGDELYVRPLVGIEAVDEAIGRATEMGRPILYVLGLGVASDVATIASFTILGRVAKRVAEYQTELIVPTYDPIVMSVAQEVVKSAYYDAGRADDYKEDTVFFVTNLQFAYVAAVNGLMLRERPATNVYMGKFYAESLLLAETGAEAGSIQIAGTDEIAQIPFFIVACDYTLIGEELFAASAYLGREPILLGSLKAQDWAKVAVIVLSIVGLIAANTGWDAFMNILKVTN